MSPSETTTAGTAMAVTLTAIGSNGLATPSYRGTVHLSSSDPAAVLPADLTFSATDNGTKVVKVVLKTAGLNSLSATDTGRRSTARHRSHHREARPGRDVCRHPGPDVGDGRHARWHERRHP